MYRAQSTPRKYEEHAYVLDFNPRGKSFTVRGRDGIIVTAKTEKNRFARPEMIKFHIHYKKGMNPYVGLHEYLSSILK